MTLAGPTGPAFPAREDTISQIPPNAARTLPALRNRADERGALVSDLGGDELRLQPAPERAAVTVA